VRRGTSSRGVGHTWRAGCLRPRPRTSFSSYRWTSSPGHVSESR
jgi:hypothetical protein